MESEYYFKNHMLSRQFHWHVKHIIEHVRAFDVFSNSVGELLVVLLQNNEKIHTKVKPLQYWKTNVRHLTRIYT